MQGMQYNPGQRTIEGELMEAICKAGGVSEHNAGQFTKVLLSISSMFRLAETMLHSRAAVEPGWAAGMLPEIFGWQLSPLYHEQLWCRPSIVSRLMRCCGIKILCSSHLQ